MDKKLAGLVGALGALAVAAPACAATRPAGNDALQASSYADLLRPIPNAAEVLRTLPAEPPVDARVTLVQYYQNRHHHHHHHHRHHHHHHHYQ